MFVCVFVTLLLLFLFVFVFVFVGFFFFGGGGGGGGGGGWLWVIQEKVQGIKTYNVMGTPNNTFLNFFGMFQTLCCLSMSLVAHLYWRWGVSVDVFYNVSVIPIAVLFFFLDIQNLLQNRTPSRNQ